MFEVSSDQISPETQSTCTMASSSLANTSKPISCSYGISALENLQRISRLTKSFHRPLPYSFTRHSSRRTHMISSLLEVQVPTRLKFSTAIASLSLAIESITCPELASPQTSAIAVKCLQSVAVMVSSVFSMSPKSAEYYSKTTNKHSKSYMAPVNQN